MYHLITVLASKLFVISYYGRIQSNSWAALEIRRSWKLEAKEGQIFQFIDILGIIYVHSSESPSTRGAEILGFSVSGLLSAGTSNHESSDVKT